MKFPTDTSPNVLVDALLHLVNILGFYSGELDVKDQYPRNYGPELLENPTQLFDIIIVGGGTAGSVLANRLSEVRTWKILVLEAGGVPTSNVEVPAFYEDVPKGNEVWTFQTDHEQNLCLGTEKRSCNLVFGRMLGGTSGVSNMHYERAWSKDFADFGPISFGDALVHYKNIEKFVGDKNEAQYGLDGEIVIDQFNYRHPLMTAIYDAAEAFGYPNISSTNKKMGYYEVSGYVKDGVRLNFAKAFMTPVKDRDNLYVVQDAVVTGVFLKSDNDRRIGGVDVLIGGKKSIKVRARLEVILTAGAINTAKILMLSGIGPHKQLKNLGIPVTADLPIGKNLKDQIGVPVFIGIEENSLGHTPDYIDATYEFLKNRRGRFSRTNINNLVGSIPSETAFGEPNIKIYHYFFDIKDRMLNTFLSIRGYSDEITKPLLTYNKQHPLLVMLPILLYPNSAGEMRLKTKDYKDPPIITGQYLKDEFDDDLIALQNSIKYISKLIKQPSMQIVMAKLVDLNIPNCRNFKRGTEHYWNCYIKNIGIPLSKTVGTVRYGRKQEMEDCDGCGTVLHKGNRCINEDFVIDGVRHLRIVDSSILAAPVGGCLEATVAMLADKAAESIRNTWGH